MMKNNNTYFWFNQIIELGDLLQRKILYAYIVRTTTQKASLRAKQKKFGFYSKFQT